VYYFKRALQRSCKDKVSFFFSFFFKSWPLETNYCDRDLKVTDYPIHLLCISDSQTFYLNLVSNTVGVWLEAPYIQRFSSLQLQVSLPLSRRNPNRECKLKKTIYIKASKKLKQPPYKISVPAFRLARFSLVFIKGSTVFVLILTYLLVGRCLTWGNTSKRSIPFSYMFGSGD
jgi:hypothetical protein